MVAVSSSTLGIRERTLQSKKHGRCDDLHGSLDLPITEAVVDVGISTRQAFVLRWLDRVVFGESRCVIRTLINCVLGSYLEGFMIGDKESLHIKEFSLTKGRGSSISSGCVVGEINCKPSFVAQMRDESLSPSVVREGSSDLLYNDGAGENPADTFHNHSECNFVIGIRDS